MVLSTPLATVVKGPTCHPLQRYLPLIFPSNASGRGGWCLTASPSPVSTPELAELLPQGLRRPAPCELGDEQAHRGPEPPSPSLSAQLPAAAPDWSPHASPALLAGGGRRRHSSGATARRRQGGAAATLSGGDIQEERRRRQGGAAAAAGRGGGGRLLTAGSSRTCGCREQEEEDGGTTVTRGRWRATAMCCGKWP